MSVLANEQEQLEAIKSWWKNYGKMSVLVFFLGIALSYGWKMWQHSQADFNQQASLIYDQMLSSFNQHNQDAFIAQANSLSTDFSKTPYGNMANFMLAHQAIEQGNLDKAYQELKAIMESSNDAKIRQIARVRAARILLAKHELKQALALLDTVDNSTSCLKLMKSKVIFLWRWVIQKKPELPTKPLLVEHPREKIIAYYLK